MSNYRIPKYKSQQFSHFTTLNRVILSKYSILLNIINLAQIVLIGKIIPKYQFIFLLNTPLGCMLQTEFCNAFQIAIHIFIRLHVMISFLKKMIPKQLFTTALESFFIL